MLLGRRQMPALNASLRTLDFILRFQGAGEGFEQRRLVTESVF